MGIPFDKNKTDKPEFPTPPIGEQVHVYIGQGENKNSKAGNKMLVLNCSVMDGDGEGFDFKEYLTDGTYFNYKAACIMNAAGIDPDAIDEVDDMTFRGFDAAVIFKAEAYISKKDGKEKTTVKPDVWVPRSEATIELAPDPQQPNNVQQKNPEPDYSYDIPFN